MVRSRNFLSVLAVVAAISARVSASEYSDLVQSHGPVAYWRLGETSGTTATDATGAHNGTYQNNVTLGSTGAFVGDVNTAADFGGGANDRVQVNPFGISGSGITILAWFKPNAFGDDHFVSKSNGTNISDFYWTLGFKSSSEMSTWIKIGGTTRELLCSVSSMSNNVWYFAAVTYDGATIRVYRDGVQVGSASYSGAVSTDTSVAVALGNLPSGAGNRAFNGVLDEVAVFDKGLSAAQIYELYITGGGGLLGHWKLTENSGTTANDSSSQQNNATYNNGVLLASSGPYPGAGDKAANFDGTNDHVAIPTESKYDLTGPMAVAAWIKVEAFDEAEDSIFTKGNNAWRLQRNGSTDGVNFYCESLSTNTVASTVNVNDGRWHHAVGVYTGSQLQIYIDGVISNSASSSGSIHENNRAVRIGRNDQGSARSFDGSIHDVRLYSRGLSATEVAKLYGFVGHWKLSETSGTTATDSTVFAQNGTVSGTAGWSNRCSGTNVFDFNGSNQHITIANASHLRPSAALTIAGWIKGDSWGAGSDVDIILRKGEADPNNYQLAIADGKLTLYLDDSDSSGIRSTTTLNTGQWYYVAATWDGATVKLFIDGVLDTSAARSGTIPTDTRPVYIGGRSGADLFDGMIYDVRLYNRALNPIEVAELSGQIGFWKFDEMSGTTAADSSPAGNNGALNDPSWTTGRIAGGLLFNGTSNYVSVAHAANLSLSQDITLAAWSKSTDLTGYRMAISKGTSANKFNYWLGTFGDEITFGFHNGAYQKFDTTSVNLSANTWYHLAATFNNPTDQVRVYLNGVEVLNATTTATPLVNNESLTIGKDAAGEYWMGVLDNVRVYNRVLCPSEIQALYNAGGATAGVKIVKWVEIQ